MPDPTLVVRVAGDLKELKANLAEGVNQIETYKGALKSAAAAFDGTRIVQQASAAAAAIANAGGVTALTAVEMTKANAIFTAAADKLQLMGKGSTYAAQQFTELAAATKQTHTATVDWSDVLGKASGLLATFGITASVGAMVHLATVILEDASALQSMHDKTEISVEGLQAMRIAGDATNTTLESMVAAVNMLQKRLGGDDESANRALLDLGISLSRFRELDGAQQMATLSNAIKQIHDPLRIAHDLSELFGKQWADQLPVLKRGFGELTDGSRQMSAGTVQALDEAGIALGRFWRAVKTNLGEALADVLTLSLSDLRQLNSEIQKLPAAADGEQMKNFWGAVVPPGLPKDLDAITAALTKQVEAQIAVNKAMIELDSVGNGWKGTLDQINGAVVEAVKFYLQAGVEQDKLATAYGLTAAQVKAAELALRDETAALALEVRQVADASTRWAAYSQLKMSLSGTTTQRIIADVDLWVQHEIESHVKAKTDTADFYAWVDLMRTLQIQKETQDRLLSAANSRESLIKRREEAEEWFRFVMEHTSSFTNADIAEAIKRKDVATDEWTHWGAVSSTALDKTTAKIKETTTAAEQLNKLLASSVAVDIYNFEQMVNSVNTQTAPTHLIDNTRHDLSVGAAEALAKLGWSFEQIVATLVHNAPPPLHPGPRIPGFAGGVENFGGGWAMVGERGPELAHLPRGTDIYPSGSGPSGGAAPLTIQLVVDGSVLAQVVSHHQTIEMKQRRQFPAN